MSKKKTAKSNLSSAPNTNQDAGRSRVLHLPIHLFSTQAPSPLPLQIQIKVKDRFRSRRHLHLHPSKQGNHKRRLQHKCQRQVNRSHATSSSHQISRFNPKAQTLTRLKRLKSRKVKVKVKERHRTKAQIISSRLIFMLLLRRHNLRNLYHRKL